MADSPHGRLIIRLTSAAAGPFEAIADLGRLINNEQ